jgi:hypothetical protein
VSTIDFVIPIIAAVKTIVLFLLSKIFKHIDTINTELNKCMYERIKESKDIEDIKKEIEKLKNTNIE